MHNGDTKPTRYKASAYGSRRHHRGIPRGAPGTPMGTHIKPIVKKGEEAETCNCGGCRAA